MGLVENKRVVSGFYKEIVNNKNINAIEDFLTDDYIYNGTKHGAQGQKFLVSYYLTAFSNLKNHIDFSVAEGDWVCVREKWSAKHTGDFMGVPATHKTIKWTSTAMLKIREGKICEVWDETDFLTMFKQIGRWPG
jgi:predicted ester cyclase